MANNTLKLKYRIGSIEFEAEGPSEEVEKQRLAFVSGVLPAAVDAMRQTQAVIMPTDQIIDLPEEPLLIPSQGEYVDSQSIMGDFSRISLATFVGKYGQLGDQDFTLFAAYFDEKKNGNKHFNLDSVKQYFSEARRKQSSNYSQIFTSLVKKGQIMDAITPEGKTGKYYAVTVDGFRYVEAYQPKEQNAEKKRRKPRRTTAKQTSQYISITADDLNLKNYPSIKELSNAKEKVILIMYIVSKEGKGEWFTVTDIEYLLTHIFDMPLFDVNNVFKRNKSLFLCETDENNRKLIRRRLLMGGKEIAEELIDKAEKKQER